MLVHSYLNLKPCLKQQQNYDKLLKTEESLEHARVDVGLIDLSFHSLHLTSKNSKALSSQFLDAAVITRVIQRNGTSGVGTPAVSATSLSAPEVTGLSNILLGPGGEVLDVLDLGLGFVLVTALGDGFVPWVHVRVVLGSYLVRLSVDDVLRNPFWEIIVKSKVVIVIGSDVKGVLLPTAVCLDPINDNLSGVTDIEECSKHVVHVVRMGSKVNLGKVTKERLRYGANYHKEERVVNKKKLTSPCSYITKKPSLSLAKNLSASSTVLAILGICATSAGE
jgi:hypothetical protein